MGDGLSGKSFLEVFLTKPDVIEFVFSNWTGATGIFLEFQKYVNNLMESASVRKEHEARCIQFVKNTKNPAQYMLKYKS